MHFDDRDVSGRRLFGIKKRNRKGIISEKTTLRARLKGGAQRTAIIVMIPMLLIALCVLVWFGLTSAWNALYSQNGRYTITQVEIRGARVISPDRIKQLTGVKEGLNIFALSGGTNSLRKIRRDFLEVQHGVKSFEISRQLPGKIRICIEERVPVAILGFKGDKVIDSQGHVFGHRAGMPEMPFVSGYKGPKLQPGSVMQGPLVTAALQVVDFCDDDPRLGLRLDSIELGEDRIDLKVLYEGELKDVRLTWKNMSRRDPESKRGLADKLGRLVQLMKTEEGRKGTIFDCTLDDNIRIVPRT
ncbi:MAG: hypothetical protein C0404_02970 [Verrucomicrobia bacterium]|nr:hypothetical protein [Verrucomicrobiota bacterium]